MANHSCRNRQRTTVIPVAASAAASERFSEPEVRRWPHPITQPFAAAPTDTTLQYICCSLSYQNELLGEIKTLLERLDTARSDGPEA